MRIINGEVVPQGPSHRRSSSATPLKGNTPVTLASLAAADAAQSMPPLSLPSSAHPSGAASQPHYSLSPPAALASPSPPLHYNPYLHHTTYGAASLTSGHGFVPDDAHAHAAVQAQAQMAAAYYPYMLQGFAGTGFLLGGRSSAWDYSPPPAQSDDETSSGEAASVQSPVAGASSSSSSSTPARSRASSSCPSPLLTSTVERRKSKPHITFIPTTHALTATGVVRPVLPPPVPPNAPPSRQPARDTGFNLFGLPPMYVYEIRIAPHIYLLTGLLLYMIGPPALIPLVACFFFYRWHLQQLASRARQRDGAQLAGLDAAKRAAAAPPSHALPPKVPAPMPIKRLPHNPNIHSLFDSTSET